MEEVAARAVGAAAEQGELVAQLSLVLGMALGGGLLGFAELVDAVRELTAIAVIAPPRLLPRLAEDGLELLGVPDEAARGGRVDRRHRPTIGEGEYRRAVQVAHAHHGRRVGAEKEHPGTGAERRHRSH